MAKMPTELSQKWWSTNKAKTLKSTGLGALLGKYETIWKECQGPPHRSLKKFAEAETALKAVEAGVAKAKSMCNAILHKETLGALDGYRPLIAKAKGQIESSKRDYEKIIKDWADFRKTTKTGMEQRQAEMNKLIEKADVGLKTCEQSAKAQIAEGMKHSVNLAKSLIAELKAKQESINKYLETWRTGKGPASPHLDDRPTEYDSMVPEMNKIQVDINAARQNAESRLNEAIKANGG